MKAAVVHKPGATPVFDDFEDPYAVGDAVVIDVTAAALSHVTRSRASGTHYSSGNAFPFVPGVDGVGRLSNGQRVYFLAPEHPFGGMAQKALVATSHCIPLPDDLDDVTAAALAVPGMSSWAALTERAQLARGETVLINGATGAAGRLAVQIAKHLGAGKVIATGRNVDVLKQLPNIGADLVLPLVDDGDALEASLRPVFEAGVDIVLDYLWGQSAERLLHAAAKAGEEGKRLRYVEIGSASAPKITLPSAVLRASAIELIGSGTGSVPLYRIARVINQLLQAAVPAGLAVEAKSIPLSEVAIVWSQVGSSRVVLVP